jgi:hypothetical protein
VNQSGGNVFVANTLSFGNATPETTEGTYTLSGGTLTIANGIVAPAAGTFLLQGGTLKVDSIAADLDDFDWGAGTLASYQPADQSNIVSDRNLATSTGSILDLGVMYQSDAIYHETLTVNGILDLTQPGDVLNAIGSINLLRDYGHGTKAGYVTLITADSLLGSFDSFSGPSGIATE